MKIISTFLPPAASEMAGGGLAVVMAFDTLVDQTSHVVGITIGHAQGPNLADARVSDAGLLIIDRCAAHHAMNYPQGVVVIAGVAQVPGAKQRIRQVLAKAPPNAFVLFLCANNKVYDSAFPALGVNLQSANMQSQ